MKNIHFKIKLRLKHKINNIKGTTQLKYETRVIEIDEGWEYLLNTVQPIYLRVSYFGALLLYTQEKLRRIKVYIDTKFSEFGGCHESRYEINKTSIRVYLSTSLENYVKA